MTDNEIIKALEYCANHKGCDDGCPCVISTSPCVVNNPNILFDLINRQNAEIERLKKLLKKLSEIGYCHNFQLERSDLVTWIYAVCDTIKVAKAMMEGENS